MPNSIQIFDDDIVTHSHPQICVLSCILCLIFLGEGRAGIQHEVSLPHGVPGRQLPIRGTWRMRKLSVFTAADLERRGIPEQALTPGGRKEMLSIWADHSVTSDQ